MSSETAVTLPRLLLEGLVVIASILIAFAIDAWWDERHEARARQAILGALRSDASAAQAEAARVRPGLVTGLERTAAFLALADQTPREASEAQQIDQLATGLFLSPSFDAPLGSFQALLSAGDLSYVDNPELLRLVTGLLAQVANLEREQQVLAANVGLITATMNAMGVDATRILAHLASDEWQLPSTPRETALWRHVDDPRLRSLVLSNWVRYRLCLASLEQIDANLATVLALVAEQLGDNRA